MRNRKQVIEDYLAESHTSWTKNKDGHANKAILKMIQSCR